MSRFWPMAITKEGEKLHTYQSFVNGVDAMEVFNIWEGHYGYKLKEMWVDINDEDTGEKRRMKVERRYVYTDEEVLDAKDSIAIGG